MKVKEGLRGEAIRAAAELLEMHAELQQSVLQEMLTLASMKPGVELFAQTLVLCAAVPLRLEIQAFSTLLGTLIQREAPVAQIRMTLNLVVPRGVEPLQLAPPDVDGDEARSAFAEEDGGAHSDNEEQNMGSTIPPEILDLAMCRGHPDLNGTYELDPDMTSRGRPTYAKRDEPHAVIFYRCSARDPRESGWAISRSLDSDVLAFNSRESKTVPSAGWQTTFGNTRQADPLRVSIPSASCNGHAQVSNPEIEKALNNVDLGSLRGMVTHRDQDTLEYFSHFCVLMHLEYLAEVSSVRRRRLRTGKEQLVRSGWALDNLPIKAVFGKRDGGRKMLPGWQDNGSEMIAFVLPQAFDSERCRFFRGDCVTVSEQDPITSRVGEGLVTDVKPNAMIVQLNGRMPEGKGKTWRLDKAANRVIYERQFTALLQLATTSKLPPCSELLVAAKVGDVDSWAEEMRRNTMAGGATHTRQNQYRSRSQDKNGDECQPKATRACEIAKQLPRGILDDQRLEKAKDEVKSLPDLNQSQREALLAAVSRTCTIVQGPPGTGKTHVSVQILRIWAKVLGMSPLLAASDSNVAVDNIAAGLHSAGVKAVRLGRPEKVRSHLEEITLETKLRYAREKRTQQEQANASGSDSDSQDGRAGRRHAGGPPKGKGYGKGNFGKGGGGTIDLELEHENRRQQRHKDIELQMKILREAEVVCTTTIASGGDILSKFHYAGILIDEVAQATELSAMVPIVLRGGGALKRLVLVGDHCQLPPGIASQEAELRGLSLSIYSRLQKAGIEPAFLDTQYRSHPKLAEFSSEAFYNGSLGSGIEPAKRPMPRGIAWPNSSVPIAFVEVGAPEETEGDSKFNTPEAERVLHLVRQVLCARELGLGDIGIITPYTAQVRRLRQLVRPMIPFGCDPRSLEIASVDAYQGREKELIIFSAVRSNPRGNVGFLADWRRLNVMLTRARRGLIVFGTAATLSTDPTWQRWLAWCGSNHAIHGLANLQHMLIQQQLPVPRPPSPSGGARELLKSSRRNRSSSSRSKSQRSGSGSRSMSMSQSRSKSRDKANPQAGGQNVKAKRRQHTGWDQGPSQALQERRASDAPQSPHTQAAPPVLHAPPVLSAHVQAGYAVGACNMETSMPMHSMPRAGMMTQARAPSVACTSLYQHPPTPSTGLMPNFPRSLGIPPQAAGMVACGSSFAPSAAPGMANMNMAGTADNIVPKAFMSRPPTIETAARAAAARAAGVNFIAPGQQGTGSGIWSLPLAASQQYNLISMGRNR